MKFIIMKTHHLRYFFFATIMGRVAHLNHYIPPSETKMAAEKHGWKIEFPFGMAYFQVPCWFSRGVYNCLEPVVAFEFELVFVFEDEPPAVYNCANMLLSGSQPFRHGPAHLLRGAVSREAGHRPDDGVYRFYTKKDRWFQVC